MSRRIVILSCLLVVYMVTPPLISAQWKKIHAIEFYDAIVKAESATNQTFPRIERYSSMQVGPEKNQRYTEVTFYEKWKRQYSLGKSVGTTATTYSELLLYDGVTYERLNDGVWHLAGEQSTKREYKWEPVCTEFSLKTSKISGDLVRTYQLKETSFVGDVRTSWWKVDSRRRVVEKFDDGPTQRHHRYSFPLSMGPMKKPRLGTKDKVHSVLEEFSDI